MIHLSSPTAAARQLSLPVLTVTLLRPNVCFCRHLGTLLIGVKLRK